MITNLDELAAFVDKEKPEIIYLSEREMALIKHNYLFPPWVSFRRYRGIPILIKPSSIQ